MKIVSQIMRNKKISISKEQKSPKAFSFGYKKDEFVRSKTMGKSIKFSKEEITSIIANSSFDVMVNSLLKDGYYNNGTDAIGFFKNSKQETCVGMNILNLETLNTERHDFSLDEFKEMLQTILERNITSLPASENEFRKLNSAMIEKLNDLQNEL